MMPDLTTKDALLEKMVEQTALLKENIQNMIDVLSPVGCVQAFAGSTTPDGWLLCDGSAVSRTDYADLYGVIGDTYGDGDGSTTFNLPDLADKFIEGSATAGTVKAAGLPGITGTFSSSDASGSARTTEVFTGAFKAGETTLYRPTADGTAGYRVDFDASQSSAIYGNSDTVQPPAVTMCYIIKY